MVYLYFSFLISKIKGGNMNKNNEDDVFPEVKCIVTRFMVNEKEIERLKVKFGPEGIKVIENYIKISINDLTYEEAKLLLETEKETVFIELDKASKNIYH